MKTLIPSCATQGRLGCLGLNVPHVLLSPLVDLFPESAMLATGVGLPPESKDIRHASSLAVPATWAKNHESVSQNGGSSFDRYFKGTQKVPTILNPPKRIGRIQRLVKRQS